MMRPPLFIRILIVQKGKNKIRLWFPFILVWLVFLVLAIALSPLILIAALVLWPSGLGKKLLMFGPMFFNVLNSLSGLYIQTQDQDSKVYITIK
ncbi:MAG: hypothetical protein JSV96_13555 [Candidatus Aminicenantes bacterium]|nr:MAG: hypothetical protein JSV96_13555 [Candidatus Aminicenantes bacterium]